MNPSNVFDYRATLIDGTPADLSRYRGKVLLIVNTASECVFTPQYQGLEQLYRQLHGRGLEVLGFPCNQFRSQEPGDEGRIGAFCEKNYGVSFPLFAKVDVNGDHAHPLFQHLKRAAPGVLGTQSIKWNFTKFLVSREGKVLKRYAPNTQPARIAGDIERALGS